MRESKKRKLPEGWRLEKLENLCEINPRKRKEFLRNPNAPTSFVPMEAVDELTGRITKRITRPYSEISKGYTFFEEGDVLFAKITPCMQNGKSAITDNLIDGIGFGSTEFHVLRPQTGVIKEWIYYFIRTAEFRRRAEEHFEGSAGQQRVPVDFIGNSLIPFPETLDNQIAIASEMERKMAEIDKMRQAALRQKEAIAAMQGAILREVFPYKEGEKLPEGWRWVKVRKVMEDNVQIFSPGNYDTEKFFYIDISSVDNVSKKIVTSNQILVRNAPSRAKSILKENDIIISTVRPNLNAVALAKRKHDGNICSSGFCVIRLKNGYYSPYFFHYFISPYFVETVSKMVQGAMYPAVNDDDIKNFSIPIPPTIDDQIAISNELERKMAEVNKIRQATDRQLEAIEALPGAILREVFDFEGE